jgi:tetratricopeptide (TPR) repeat protein
MAKPSRSIHKMQVAWYNKGVALYNLGKYDEAIKAYDMAIEINPRDTDAWNNKGSVFNTLVSTTRALNALTEPSKPIHDFLEHGTIKAMLSKS